MSNLAKNYNRKKLSFKKGKGSFLYGVDGVKYLDFVQGIAVNSLFLLIIKQKNFGMYQMHSKFQKEKN